MPKKELTTEILTAALEGFEAQKKRLEEQIAELKAMLGGVPKKQAAGAGPKKGKRTLSAAARAAISEAQKRRWAKAKQASGGAAQPAAAVPAKKRQLSAAGRLAIVEAARRRWAKAKAAQQAPKPAAASKRTAKKVAKKKAPKLLRRRAAKAAAPAAESAGA